MTKKDPKAQESPLPEVDQKVDMDAKGKEKNEPDADAGVNAGPGSTTAQDPAMEAETGILNGEEGGGEGGVAADVEADAGFGIDVQTELESVQDELDRLRNQHLRLAADFENYRKRASADLAGVWARAQSELVRSLVEGLDDLQRVSRFTSEDTTVDALIEGVDLVERNLLKALTEAGLRVLNPEGERFDPNSMEAMMRVPTEEDGQDETVQRVFQKGYMFKDQLVRPARVSVFMDDD